ncbi:MAG: hypothetical protein GXP09_07985 [Gammaproteobacteria bacterium]|nr:hypothetical protein [Gammaproteobacteria bacterium]
MIESIHMAIDHAAVFSVPRFLPLIGFALAYLASLREYQTSNMDGI